MNSPGLRWSAQLRINALWSVWITYFVCITSQFLDVPTRHLWLDLLFLTGISLISAVWNDWSDKEVDIANSRLHTWHTLSPNLAKLIVIFGTLCFTITAVFDIYRLILLVHILPVGLLYNYFGWSKRPYVSLLLYAIYYRIFPIVLGLSANTAPLHLISIITLLTAVGIIRFSTGIHKDIPDQKGDKIYNKNTFVLRFGEIKSAGISWYLWIIGGIILAFFVFYSRDIPFVTYVAGWSVATLIRYGLYQHRDQKNSVKIHFTHAFQAENILLLTFLIAHMLQNILK